MPRTAQSESARSGSGLSPANARAVAGYAGKVLAAASHSADLLVMGNRGTGGFQGLLVGSTSWHALAEACCPVIVVRGDALDAHSRIVAAVDIDENCDAVVDFAFDEASRRGAGLTVTHVWDEPWIVSYGQQDPGIVEDVARIEREREDRLAALGHHAGGLGDIRVRTDRHRRSGHQLPRGGPRGLGPGPPLGADGEHTMSGPVGSGRRRRLLGQQIRLGHHPEYPSVVVDHRHGTDPVDSEQLGDPLVVGVRLPNGVAPRAPGRPRGRRPWWPRPRPRPPGCGATRGHGPPNGMGTAQPGRSALPDRAPPTEPEDEQAESPDCSAHHGGS